MTTDRTPLGPDDWLMAGFRALALGGPEALRAEALARSLNVTKGSFYWHFTDIAAFRDALLRKWEREAYDNVVARLDISATAAQRLRALCSLAVSYCDPIYGGSALEPAMRAWGRTDPSVAAVVQRMDALRLEFVEGLCRECGLMQPHLARVLYGATIGLDALKVDDVQTHVDGMMALLSGLGLP